MTPGQGSPAGGVSWAFPWITVSTPVRNRVGPGPWGGERQSQRTQEKCRVGVLASRAAWGRGGASNGPGPLHPPRPGTRSPRTPGPQLPTTHCTVGGQASSSWLRPPLTPAPPASPSAHAAGHLQANLNTLACAPHIHPRLPSSGFRLPEASHSPSPDGVLLLLCSFKSFLRPVLRAALPSGI